jgi:phenylacetate-CoA ligase
MIKYKGTTLYPSAIYDILNEIDLIDNYHIEVSTGNLGTDEILINVGCKAKCTNAEKIIKDHFRAKMRVAPEIQLIHPNEIKKMQLGGLNRKPIIFLDNRK